MLIVKSAALLSVLLQSAISLYIIYTDYSINQFENNNNSYNGNNDNCKSAQLYIPNR